MKTLCILLFIAATFPARAVSTSLEYVVCTDHYERTTSVYYDVQVPEAIFHLRFSRANTWACKHIDKLKHNTIRGN